MPAPYSDDLRRKVVAAYERGEGSMRTVARRFSVGLGFVRDLIKRYRQTGDIKPKTYRHGFQPKVRGAKEEAVQAWVQEAPDVTLKELCRRYRATFHQPISQSAMDRALKRLGLTRKKRPSSSPSGKASGSKNCGSSIKRRSQPMPPISGSISMRRAQRSTLP